MNWTSLQIILEQYESIAHESMAVLTDTPESIVGKPWDFAHYIHTFRVEENGLFLEVDTYKNRISGRLNGLASVGVQPHPWGCALILKGQLHWKGTCTSKLTGLIKLVAEILPFLSTEKTLNYEKKMEQLTLILPCS